MRLNLNKKNLISLAVFSGVTLALVFLVISPLIQGIKENSEQLLLEKEAQTTFLEEKENLQNFKTVYQEIEADLEKLDGLFVNTEVPAELIDFLDFLEGTAVDFDVLIKISSASAGESKENPWPFQSFRIQAYASFSDFSRFIEKLENSNYLIEISELNLRPLTEGDLASEELAGFSVGAVSASISLKVYAK